MATNDLDSCATGTCVNSYACLSKEYTFLESQMKQRGMTLIEIMILCVIASIVIMVAIPVLVGGANTSNITYGAMGMTESRCIEGYKFIIDQRGNSRQILDEFGKGVRCENPNAGKPGSFGSM